MSVSYTSAKMMSSKLEQCFESNTTIDVVGKTLPIVGREFSWRHIAYYEIISKNKLKCKS